MSKYLTLMAAASLIGVVAFAGQANAGNGGIFTCKSGGITIKSLSPCYVTTYGIHVPGAQKSGDGAGNHNGGKKDNGPNGKKGGGLDGPKGFKDKPDKGGFNGKGPGNIKS
nr:hypothetical protein [uncultured Dongia sp.]